MVIITSWTSLKFYKTATKLRRTTELTDTKSRKHQTPLLILSSIPNSWQKLRVCGLGYIAAAEKEKGSTRLSQLG